METTGFAFQKMRAQRAALHALEMVAKNRERFLGLPGEVGPQMEKALVSVVLNLAEGAGRWTPADQRRHYQIALGSAAEVMAALEIARIYGRVSDSLFAALSEKLEATRRMTLGLIRRR